MNTLLQVIGIPTLIILYIVGVIIFRRRRAWLLYYLLASVGLTFILVFGSRLTGVADVVEGAVTYSTAVLASFVGFNTRFIGQNSLLVQDSLGWVVLETNIECSAIIETSILAGLIFFYPKIDWSRKTIMFIVGLVVTTIANLMRLLIITGMTATLGRSAVFWGHAVVGRIFFFIVIIILYWYIITKPTINQIAKSIGQYDEGT